MVWFFFDESAFRATKIHPVDGGFVVDVPDPPGAISYPVKVATAEDALARAARACWRPAWVPPRG